LVSQLKGQWRTRRSTYWSIWACESGWRIRCWWNTIELHRLWWYTQNFNLWISFMSENLDHLYTRWEL